MSRTQLSIIILRRKCQVIPKKQIRIKEGWDTVVEEDGREEKKSSSIWTYYEANALEYSRWRWLPSVALPEEPPRAAPAARDLFQVVYSVFQFVPFTYTFSSPGKARRLGSVLMVNPPQPRTDSRTNSLPNPKSAKMRFSRSAPPKKMRFSLQNEKPDVALHKHRTWDILVHYGHSKLNKLKNFQNIHKYHSFKINMHTVKTINSFSTNFIPYAIMITRLNCPYSVLILLVTKPFWGMPLFPNTTCYTLYFITILYLFDFQWRPSLPVSPPRSRGLDALHP